MALDAIYKAAGEDPPDIWDEHPNPFIRRMIEIFTHRGLMRMDGMRDEMAKWLSGDMHQASATRPPRPPGAMERWSGAELGLVKLYLETLPASEFLVDDWMMLVDYLAQRYLPASDLRTEAEWLSTRANLMGRVQAAMGDVSEPDADRLLAALPVSAAAADAAWGMTVTQRALLDYGNARCVENVVALSDTVRHRMRNLILDYQGAQVLGDRTKTAESLQTQLLDSFGLSNRDWRRIAVTEAGENLNQGMISSLPAGSRVRRVEKYRGACAFCRSIDGRVMSIVDPSSPKLDGETQIWAGKTNIGRSASPMKRVAGGLVERAPRERWWIAAGVMHPNCRGGWVPISEPTRRADPKFSAWMDEVLGRDGERA